MAYEMTADKRRYFVRVDDTHRLERQLIHLTDALRKIDADLEGRNFLESSSLRDTARTALQSLEGK